MRKTTLRAALLIPLLLVLAAPLGAVDEEFDADRALRNASFARALQTIADEDDAYKAFEAHGIRAFGISNQLIGFLHELAGGEYTTQLETLMDVPVQQWNPNRGWTGSYDIVNVKRLVNQNQTSSLFGRVKDSMGHVATAVSCIQVGRDIAKGLQGDDAAKLNALHGTYNVLVGWWIKELSWQSLGTAMMGVGVISTALTEFQATATQQYEDYWWTAYTNYMENKYPRLVTGSDSWAALARTEGNTGVRNRLYEFWKNAYVNAGENYGRAGIQTAPDLARRTLSDKFAALYYRNSVHSTLKTYFRLEAEKAEAAAWIEGRREWARLRALLADAEQLRLAVLDATDNEDETALRELSVAAASGDYREGDRIVFTATATYADDRSTDVTALCEWSRNAPGGVVEAADGGAVTAQATFAERTATGSVQVNALTGLTGAPDPARLRPGEGVTFTVEAAWADGTTRDVSAEAEWPGDLPGGSYPGSAEPGERTWRVGWQGASCTVSAEVAAPASVNVDPAAVRLKPGEEQAFTAEAVYGDGASYDVTAEARWGADASGPSFTADAVGTYRVEALYQEVAGAASVEVMAPRSIVMDPAAVRLRLGESTAFSVRVTWPDGSADDVTGEVSWPAEAPGGRFTAREVGTIALSADYHGAPVTASVEVTGPRSLTLSPAAASIRLNESVDFTATAVFDDGGTEDVTALVEFTGCAAGGHFTPERPGTATITAAYGGTSATASVDVAAPDQLVLEPAASTIEAGERVAFTATARFTDGTVDDVTAAATYVNAPGGVFSGTAPGSHRVTAGYGGLSAVASVTVEPGGVLALTPASGECAVGGTVSFRADLVRPDGTRENVSGRAAWSGAAGGVFTGRVPGESLVTATVGGLSASARVTVEEGDADVTLDDAVEEIGDETSDELCSADELRVVSDRVRALLAAGDAAYANFEVFALKFEKELADRAADPCGNSLLAYCYAGASATAGELESVVDSIEDAATTLLAMRAWCPDTAAALADGFDSQSLISELAALGADNGAARRRLAAMSGRLAEYGCDENDFEQLGESITEDGMDPDLLQDGGSMQEIGGDGVDNDSDGLQEENVQALSGYNVTVVLYDSGSAKDDVFHLTVSGVGNLGATPSGGLRSYGLNLPPGTYTATVTVVLAPDDVGTFTILVMENGETIASGSGAPAQGAVFALPFTITGAPEE